MFKLDTRNYDRDRNVVRKSTHSSTKEARSSTNFSNSTLVQLSMKSLTASVVGVDGRFPAADAVEPTYFHASKYT